MSLRRLAPSSLYAEVPYAYATVAPSADDLVFLAGACPLDGEGNVVAADDPVGQAPVVMANLRAVLQQVGSTVEDLVKTTVYVVTADHDELVRAWEAVRRELGPTDPPSTLVGVSMLGYTGQRLEVEAVAVARSRDSAGGTEG
jgi:enamine deaminase RidA (YjgF/YER057c/UK114 family)